MVHKYFLCGGAGPSQCLQLNDGIQPTALFSVPELENSVNNINAFQQKGNNELLLHLSISLTHSVIFCHTRPGLRVRGVQEPRAQSLALIGRLEKSPVYHEAKQQQKTKATNNHLHLRTI